MIMDILMILSVTFVSMSIGRGTMVTTRHCGLFSEMENVRTFLAKAIRPIMYRMLGIGTMNFLWLLLVDDDMSSLLSESTYSPITQCEAMSLLL